MKIKCIIIDDEPLAAEGIQGYVDRIPYLITAGTFSSALDVLDKLEELKPDLLLLDIQMPYLTGLDLIKNLEQPPKVILTTAYDQYAVEGYELDVVDYLMKPISFERFIKACEKVKRIFKTPASDWFFVKTDKRTERIRYEDICWLEAMQNYVLIHLAAERHTVHLTLQGLLEQLPAEQFIQTHKSYAVNICHIDAIEGNRLVIKNQKIPVSRSKREQVLEKIVNAKLIRR